MIFYVAPNISLLLFGMFPRPAKHFIVNGKLKVHNLNFKNHVVNEQIIKGFKWFDPKLRLGLGIILRVFV